MLLLLLLLLFIMLLAFICWLERTLKHRVVVSFAFIAFANQKKKKKENIKTKQQQQRRQNYYKHFRRKAKKNTIKTNCCLLLGLLLGRQITKKKSKFSLLHLYSFFSCDKIRQVCFSLYTKAAASCEWKNNKNFTEKTTLTTHSIILLLN